MNWRTLTFGVFIRHVFVKRERDPFLFFRYGLPLPIMRAKDTPQGLKTCVCRSSFLSPCLSFPKSHTWRRISALYGLFVFSGLIPLICPQIIHAVRVNPLPPYLQSLILPIYSTTNLIIKKSFTKIYIEEPKETE